MVKLGVFWVDRGSPADERRIRLALTASGGDGLVKGDCALRKAAAERECKKYFVRDAIDGWAGDVFEAELSVIGRGADQAASAGVESAQTCQPCADQCLADALLLALCQDQDRPQAVSFSAVRDGDRGKGDVSDDLAIDICDQRYAERFGTAQCFDNELFRMAADFQRGEGGNGELPDAVDIFRGCIPDAGVVCGHVFGAGMLKEGLIGAEAGKGSAHQCWS